MAADRQDKAGQGLRSSQAGPRWETCTGKFEPWPLIECGLGQESTTEYNDFIPAISIVTTFSTCTIRIQWRRLYVPKAYNYEAIDAFIAMLNKEERTLKLFAIQVTIANKHKDSEKQFFNKWWRQYYTSIPDKFKRHYTVSVAFVWLHRGEYVTEGLKSIAEHIKVVDGPSEYKQFKIPLETIHNSFDKL